MATELSFESVNAHVEQHLTEAKLKSFAANPPSLCSIYVIVKPILTVIAAIPLIPQKWKDGIKVLIAVLDTLCPSE